mmetsp:Transcript_17375/g.35976  ORF Transcript_17375/g.35976 Transcript_17375/m.35976 type:complete len:451 (-) Transcript_17375:2229-3581(-)
MGTDKTNNKKHNGCPPTEFGGPIGAFGTVVALPILVMILAHWAKVGYLDLNFPGIFEGTHNLLFGEKYATELLAKCTLGLLGWFLGLVLLWKILPGKWVEGAPVIDPEADHSAISKDKAPLRLKYKLNGHATYWTVMILLVATRFPLNDYIYRHYERIAFVDILLCFGLSAWLYWSSFQKDPVTSKDKILSHTGRSGNAPYDFFMGRELNPRSLGGTFDWKEFCELRPGLILWVLLNVACAQEQHRLTGSVSGSMVLLNIFHAIYVWDSMFMEKCILTTMDITTDGFGFMLVFGDLAWVPFTYNHPAKFLVHHDPRLSNPVLAGILALYVLGFAIFRLSNRQKDIFRNDPNDPRVAHLTYLPTKRGTRLLTSGWWGLARKINYTGDYMMGLSYSLLCGFDSIVPYYYAVYFLVLLVHRSIRDDDLCSEKYGDDWKEYKRLVPYRFIPGVV